MFFDVLEKPSSFVFRIKEAVFFFVRKTGTEVLHYAEAHPLRMQFEYSQH